MSGFAARILAGLGDNLQSKAGDVLSDLVDALTDSADIVDTLLRPVTNGWPAALDLAATPQPAWLAQLAGVRVDASQSLASQRAQILAHPMWKRGTPAAITALAQTFLNGTKRVDLYERDGGNPWALRFRVYTPQLIDPATTVSAIKALTMQTKPIGIDLTVEIFPGVTYGEISTRHASYAALNTAVANYNDMLTIL